MESPRNETMRRKAFHCYDIIMSYLTLHSWWRHQMETFSALLALCAGNSPVPGEFSAQRPVTRSFDVFFDPRPNKRLSKQSWGWWFETLSCSLWRHRNVTHWWPSVLPAYHVVCIFWVPPMVYFIWVLCYDIWTARMQHQKHIQFSSPFKKSNESTTCFCLNTICEYL